MWQGGFRVRVGLDEGAGPWERQKETLGATPASVHHPRTRACRCGFRGTACWHLPALSYIYSPAFLQDLCFDLLCFLCWTHFPEGTSQFWMHGGFFRDSTTSLSAKGLRMPLPKLPRLILDIGEEFVKNIVFCVTEHCNTQSIWYFKSTKFHYLYAQYSI